MTIRTNEYEKVQGRGGKKRCNGVAKDGIDPLTLS